jgi:hypothetical protein
MVFYATFNNISIISCTVYPIELETKGMTDIDRHILYPDLHLDI